MEWEMSDLVEILEHDSVPVCEASVNALTMVLDARADCADEQEVMYLETQMLRVFTALTEGAVQ